MLPSATSDGTTPEEIIWAMLRYEPTMMVTVFALVAISFSVADIDRHPVEQFSLQDALDLLPNH